MDRCETIAFEFFPSRFDLRCRLVMEALEIQLEFRGSAMQVAKSHRRHRLASAPQCNNCGAQDGNQIRETAHEH